MNGQEFLAMGRAFTTSFANCGFRTIVGESPSKGLFA